MNKKIAKKLCVEVSGIVVGSIASTAVGYFLKAYAPALEEPYKQLVMKVGIGLVSGIVGNAVASDIVSSTNEALDMVEKFKEEYMMKVEEVQDGRA